MMASTLSTFGCYRNLYVYDIVIPPVLGQFSAVYYGARFTVIDGGSIWIYTPITGIINKTVQEHV